MLALPEGESTIWARHRERLDVVGPWPVFERQLADVLKAALVDYDGAHLLDRDGTRWAFGGGGDGSGGELLYGAPPQRIGAPRDPRWALVRVRVSVEVLDGVL
jgi:hypothetical protein